MLGRCLALRQECVVPACEALNCQRAEDPACYSEVCSLCTFCMQMIIMSILPCKRQSAKGNLSIYDSHRKLLYIYCFYASIPIY